MKKREFYFPSQNQKNRIHCVEWIPEKRCRGILQISHGMVEYVERYEEFAAFLTERGFLVVGNDHMGHGKSVDSQTEWGYFTEKDASRKVIEDMHRLTSMTKEKYPNIPYFLLGHSMGSFMARRYLMTYGQELDGAILLGTGNQPGAVIFMGMFMAECIGAIYGQRYRSEWLKKAAFGTYNKHFQPIIHGNEWLSKNEADIKKYMNTPACTFSFTVNGYQTLFSTIQYIEKRKNISSIPKNLPIVFLSGKDDPVGNYGKDVYKVYRIYKKCGIRDVKIKLYEKDRHEILMELDREQVYYDIERWMKQHMGCNKKHR